MNFDLFGEQQEKIEIAEGAYFLKGFALPFAGDVLQAVSQHIDACPPQKMMTPMGYEMSVTTTSMGNVGWVSSKTAYAYSNKNPQNGNAWPVIPKALLALAASAAQASDYLNFSPDCCLVNVYAVGSKMGLHQDKDERDFSQPVVSVSLGIPATFLMGGAKRNDRTLKVSLVHGDVIVFGGASRLFFHGVLPLKQGNHPFIGQQRINLTFRKAL